MVKTTENNGDKTATEKKFEKRREEKTPGEFNGQEEEAQRRRLVTLRSVGKDPHPLRLFLHEDVWGTRFVPSETTDLHSSNELSRRG